MTREEAIRILDYERPNGNCGCGASDEEIEEALTMAIKALEQEPCEDAISRQSVDQNIYDYAESNGLSYANLKNAILDTTSVTPTRKKGKWIKSNIGGAKVCSVCQAHMGLSNFNYCPNCGAEMESEDNGSN